MKYTDQLKKALQMSKRISKKLNHSYIGTEHLLIALMNVKDSISSDLFAQEGLDSERVIELIRDLIALDSSDFEIVERSGNTPKLTQVLEQAESEAMLGHSDSVGTEHALLAILKTPDCAASRLLSSLNVNFQKMFSDIVIAMGEQGEIYRNEMIQKNKSGNLSDTPLLDKYSSDITKKAKNGELDPVIGREEEILRAIQILSRRTKNNPCLMGEPGVGKTAIVEGLALRIVSGMVPDSVKDKRLLALDLSGIVAGTKYRGEFEERIKGLMDEVIHTENVLLFIDELHTLIGAGNGSGSLDAANILKPALARGELQVIGATTVTEYRKHIEKDAALERRFQPIMVEEPTIEQAKDILMGIRSKYEDHHNVIISDEAVNACVELSERYITDRFLPDKAIDLMDEAAAKCKLFTVDTSEDLYKKEEQIFELEKEMEDALRDKRILDAKRCKKKRDSIIEELELLRKKYERRKKTKKITIYETDIAEVVAIWTKIPVAKLTESEAARLKNLEQELHKRIIGQEEAVSALSRAVRRGRVGLKEPNRPIGSFLFLGPTGVGKTEVSKALAEAVFGNEENMIRVDMTEYMEKHSVSKMIGSPPGYVGYEEGGQLSEKVRRNPYSVLLFDEIEKAHPDVFNILLQVLDDGRITDAQGRKVDFKNTIIIMTSNIGARDIVEPKKLGFLSTEDDKADFELMKSKVMAELKRELKPEFLNRIDEQIVFRALNKNDLKKIVSLLTKSLVNRCKEQMDITLNISNSVNNYIVEKAYDPKFGARPLRRKIQSDIEDPLAEEILSKKIKKGTVVDVTINDHKVVFKTKKEAE